MSVPVTRFLLPNAIIGGGEVSEGLGPWRLPRASPDTPHALARQHQHAFHSPKSWHADAVVGADAGAGAGADADPGF